MNPWQENVIRQFHSARQANLQQTNPDSSFHLAQLVSAIADSTHDSHLKLESQIIISHIFNQKELSDSALFLLNKIQVSSQKLHDSAALTEIYQQLAQSYYDKQLYDSAENYLKKGVSLAIKTNQMDELADFYKGFGDLLRKKTKFDSSYSYYQQALKLYLQNNNAINAAVVLNSISNVFAEQLLLPQARQYLNRAIRINDSMGNTYALGINYNNLGIFYKNEKILDSAAIFLMKSIEISKELGDPLDEIISTFNLANVYSNNGEYRKADSAFNVVYDYCIENKFTIGIIKALSGKAENEIRQNHHAQAKNMLTEALDIAKKEGEYQDHKDILAQLVNLEFDLRNDTPNYFDQYQALSDSMFNTKYIDAIAKAEITYAVELKDTSIKLLQSQNLQKKYENIFLLVTVVFILIISILLLINYKRKVDQLKKQKELDSEKHKNRKLMLQRSELNLQLKQQQLIDKSMTTAKYESNLASLADELILLKTKLRTKTDREFLEATLQKYQSQVTGNPLSEFETAFKAIYPDFFRNILQKHPELTPREVQICALIRLNLQTKQIAMITNNSPKSMEILRYRIRKKMGLLTDQSLSNELKNF